MIPGGWVTLTVGTLEERGEAEIKTGPFGTQLHASDYVEVGTPVINVRNIGFGSIRPEKLEFVDEETVERLSSHVLKIADIVFGRKGAVERHVLVRAGQDGWFQGSDCIRLRLDSNTVGPEYASYSFLTPQHQQWMMNQGSHGATMASLNQDIIRRIPLVLPPLPTQHKITAILSAYDDLIENNLRRIQILEEMAQNLYREWFVKFRFPDHESVRMVDSDLGQIPSGWEAKPLGKLSDLKWGDTSTTKKSYVSEGYDAYSAKGMDGKLDHYDFYRDGIVLSAIGAQCGKSWFATGRWSCIKNTIRFWADCESVSTEFLFYATRRDDFWPKRGAAQPFISQGDARASKVVVPGTTLMTHFTNFAKLCLNQINVLSRANNVLSKSRDFLLPKLMSGELDVSDLDIAIPEEAA